MNRKEFINEVSKRKGISRTKAYHSVNAVMDTIRMVLWRVMILRSGASVLSVS